mmetsp:Transcript_33596/g.60492  ORF Transcript_33596/g.60492 Transcript_33596/m.60492 type:complete len:96 (-) Transcript_33596:285-572(-)
MRGHGFYYHVFANLQTQSNKQRMGGGGFDAAGSPVDDPATSTRTIPFVSSNASSSQSPKDNSFELGTTVAVSGASGIDFHQVFNLWVGQVLHLID